MDKRSCRRHNLTSSGSSGYPEGIELDEKSPCRTSALFKLLLDRALLRNWPEVPLEDANISENQGCTTGCPPILSADLQS